MSGMGDAAYEASPAGEGDVAQRLQLPKLSPTISCCTPDRLDRRTPQSPALPLSVWPSPWYGCSARSATGRAPAAGRPSLSNSATTRTLPLSQPSST